MPEQSDTFLTREEERTLLALARCALEAHLRDGSAIDPVAVNTTPALMRNRACFVTLRANDGGLRGCIGSTAHIAPLVVSVRDNTIRSAVDDPRFEAVRSHELVGIAIEISVLADGDALESPFRRVGGPEDIVIGRDGVYMEYDGRGAGLLLPQVATERDWSVHEFLDALCLKSALDRDAWHRPEAILYRFGAQIFHE